MKLIIVLIVELFPTITEYVFQILYQAERIKYALS